MGTVQASEGADGQQQPRRRVSPVAVRIRRAATGRRAEIVEVGETAAAGQEGEYGAFSTVAAVLRSPVHDAA